MNGHEVQRLSQLFAICAGYYRLKLDDAVLRMYASDLSDLEFEDVKQALELYRRDPKNKHMPLPAMIREMLAPAHESDDAQAREIAARISSAVIKHGWTCPNEAREFIGETGWEVVRLNGGWSHLCRELGVGIDMNQFAAQARELAKGLLAKKSKIVSRHLELASTNSTPQIQGSAEEPHSITADQIRELMRTVGLGKSKGMS